MTHSLRLAIPLALLLVVGAVAVALANRGTDASRPPDVAASSHEAEPDDVEAQDAEDEAPPTAEDLAHAAARLRDARITVDDAQLADLATRYGVGGAVRLLAWSAETGMDVEAIASMRDGADGGDPMGWGRIAKQLDVHPGIGSIMGNGGGNRGGNGNGGGNGPPGSED